MNPDIERILREQAEQAGAQDDLGTLTRLGTLKSPVPGPPRLDDPRFPAWNRREIEAFNQQIADNLHWLLLGPRAAWPGFASSNPGPILRHGQFLKDVAASVKHGVRRVQLGNLGVPERMRAAVYPKRLRYVMNSPNVPKPDPNFGDLTGLIELARQFQERE